MSVICNRDTALPTDGSKIQIVTGTNEWRDPNAARYSVRRIIVHEKFDVSDYLNDIALIQTQSPIEFNERVQPIKFTSTPVLPGALLQITGWGTLKVGQISHLSRKLASHSSMLILINFNT